MDTDGSEKGTASDWSPEESIVTQGLPGSVFVDLNPEDHDKIQVTWDLPEEDKDWEYGVDVTYQLLQTGRCQRERGFRGTKYEVMDKRVTLDVRQLAILCRNLWTHFSTLRNNGIYLND